MGVNHPRSTDESVLKVVDLVDNFYQMMTITQVNVRTDPAQPVLTDRSLKEEKEKEPALRVVPRLVLTAVVCPEEGVSQDNHSLLFGIVYID